MESQQRRKPRKQERLAKLNMQHSQGTTTILPPILYGGFPNRAVNLLINVNSTSTVGEHRFTSVASHQGRAFTELLLAFVFPHIFPTMC
jgi:hypothetical protein